MLLQYDLNKWRLIKLEKLDNLYINAASTRLLQRSKKYYIAHKNQIFPKKSQIHIRALNAAPSYYFPAPIIGSKIPKWDCKLNCCAKCTGINAPYLE